MAGSAIRRQSRKNGRHCCSGFQLGCISRRKPFSPTMLLYYPVTPPGGHSGVSSARCRCTTGRTMLPLKEGAVKNPPTPVIVVRAGECAGGNPSSRCPDGYQTLQRLPGACRSQAIDMETLSPVTSACHLTLLLYLPPSLFHLRACALCTPVLPSSFFLFLFFFFHRLCPFFSHFNLPPLSH